MRRRGRTVFTVACVGGWLVTRRTYRLWHARVRTGTFRRSRRAWVAWLVWYAALVLAASLLGLPGNWLWAAVGLLAGLPLVGYGAWLASQGR